ncbi:MAG: hypothetical protein IPK97_01735 [Ahniella sp.]|nr:hypothetical protein [Ahniella sp.]
MSLHRLMLSATITLSLLGAAAAVRAEPATAGIDYEQMAGATVAFIEQRKMDRFDQVDDHHMIVWAKRDQAYLVTFNSSCRRYTLEDPMVIERTSNFRLYPEDRITINGTPCMIRDIRILDVPAVKAARASAKR